MQLFIEHASFIQYASSIYRHAVQHCKINHDIFINYTSISSTPVTPLINLTIKLDTQLEPGPLGDGQPACEGALSDDVHVHVIKPVCLVKKSRDLPSCPTPW